MVESERLSFAVSAMIVAIRRAGVHDKGEDQVLTAYAAIEAAMWHRSALELYWGGIGARREGASERANGLHYVANKGVHDSLARMERTRQIPFLETLTISSSYTYKWQSLTEWEHLDRSPERNGPERAAYMAAVEGKPVVPSLSRGLLDLREHLVRDGGAQSSVVQMIDGVRLDLL